MDPIVVALAEDTLGTASSGDGVVFWRWLAVQLFPDWSGRLAGSSVWLRPSARSCRSLPFLRPRFLPSRHVLRLFLSFTLSLSLSFSLSLFLSFFLSLSLSLSSLSSVAVSSQTTDTTSRNRLPVRNSPRDVHVALTIPRGGDSGGLHLETSQ